MPISAAKRAGNDRYNAKCDTIQIRPQKATGERIRAAAAAAGESLQGYILQAVEERMERDQAHQRLLDVSPGYGDTMTAHDRETGEAYATSTDGINWTKIDDNQ